MGRGDFGAVFVDDQSSSIFFKRVAGSIFPTDCNRDRDGEPGAPAPSRTLGFDFFPFGGNRHLGRIIVDSFT